MIHLDIPPDKIITNLVLIHVSAQLFYLLDKLQGHPVQSQDAESKILQITKKKSLSVKEFYKIK